jgi:autophagy-related protein 17
MQDSHDILSSSLALVSTEIKDLKFLVDSINIPSPLPTISHSSASLPHSKTYSTHSEKQDYHAHHLALLLTSLAQHYDQTSSALKDTESPLGQTSPIGPETLEILSRDAAEVTEVLDEMEDHVREIEHSSDIVQTHSEKVRKAYDDIVRVFDYMEDYGRGGLTKHIARVKDFDFRGQEHREHISALKQEMANLVLYYTNFGTSYEALLDEVRRRQEVQSHTQLLVGEVATKFAGMYEQEVRARQAFMDLHAGYLPQDLWRGIYDPPIRVNVTTEEGGVLPVLGVGKKRLSAVDMEKIRSAEKQSVEGSGERKRSMEGARR